MRTFFAVKELYVSSMKQVLKPSTVTDSQVTITKQTWQLQKLMSSYH